MNYKWVHYFLDEFWYLPDSKPSFFGVEDLQSRFLQFNKRNVLVKIVIWTKSDGCFLKGWYIFQSLLLKNKQTNKQNKNKKHGRLQLELILIKKILITLIFLLNDSFTL